MTDDTIPPSRTVSPETEDSTEDSQTTRRDFLYLATGSVGMIGMGAAAWPLIDSMNPAADTLALSSIEVDLSSIQEGQAITVVWRGKPVFIRRRTPEEIQQATAVALDDLPDPEQDNARVQKPEWLIVIGVCTHLGCVPKETDSGWFCPCHGSFYDISGRIRQGPAPANLPVPEYVFLSDSMIRLG